LDCHRKRFGPDSSLVADALLEYADELWERGESAVAKARATQEEALALYRKGKPPRSRLDARCLWYIAADRGRRQDYRGGGGLLGEALEAARHQYGDGHACVAAIQSQLVWARLKQGKTEGAEELLGQARETLRGAGGDHARDLAGVYAGL